MWGLPCSCTPATAFRRDAIDIVRKMFADLPKQKQATPFDMLILDRTCFPTIAYLSAPLAGQSSGVAPGAPLQATANWERATCMKHTWIPAEPDWQRLTVCST